MRWFKRLLSRRNYKHTNSQGVDYYLHRKDCVLQGGKKMSVLYFRREPNENACSLPKTHTVLENPRNGFLSLKKSGSTKPNPQEYK